MDQTFQPLKKNSNASDAPLSFIPLGGLEDVTKNMYVYEYKDEILLVECGIGFADETMLGVDLLLPDISYLLNTKKKIVGMVITHGHEDHMGALPFILPQLPSTFPIYGSPFTAALANEKLKGFDMKQVVKTVSFDNPTVKIGSFSATFMRITHSVPDSASIFIQTPVGNIIHTGDFKFDLTPADGNHADFLRITDSARKGVLALMSDCLGSERPGHTPTETKLYQNIEMAMRDCKGKFILTTYSTQISRLNQTLKAAEKLGRKVCFVGRSLLKVKDLAQRSGYMHIPPGMEIEIDAVKRLPENEILLLVAGSQGQENSALTRIANDEHKELSLSPNDTVVLSSDPIPGNEISVTSLIDAIAKKGAKVIYSTIAPQAFHVSGHGSADELLLMISLTKPKFLVPVSGNYKHMKAYQHLGNQMGYEDKNIVLTENGQEILFTKDSVSLGRKIEIRNVFVDQISGEEVESYVLRDREKLAKEGIVIIMTEINAATGQLLDAPALVTRGFNPADQKTLTLTLPREVQNALSMKKGKVNDWVYLRKLIGDVANKHIFKTLRRRPLVLPVIIEI